MISVMYRMEMKRNFKSFIIWSLSICGIIFLGMLFYPVINTDGLINQMSAMFENPMMKGLLSAFGADVTSLSSLTGFYVTYNSIYNILLGCLFAAVLGCNLVAKEEEDKTAEFLLTRPVTRRNIYLTKVSVLFSYVTLLGIFIFIASILSLEAVKKDSPLIPVVSSANKALIIDRVKKHSDAVYDAFNIDENNFARYSLSYASEQLNHNRKKIRKMDLDPAAMNSLLEQAMETGPEDFFKEVLAGPEKYMALFSFPPELKAEFIENVRKEQQEYQTMKREFFDSPDIFIMLFEDNPAVFLNQFTVEKGTMTKAIRLLDLPRDMEDRILKKYSMRTIAILCVYFYLLVLTVGALIVFLSVFIKRGRSILGLALGLVFIFYFIESITKTASAISPASEITGYISPFSWMDLDFTRPGYGFTLWRILLFCILSVFSITGGLRIFSKKDILI